MYTYYYNNFILIMIFNGDQYTPPPPPPRTFNLTTVYDVTLTNVGKIGHRKNEHQGKSRRKGTLQKMTYKYNVAQ